MTKLGVVPTDLTTYLAARGTLGASNALELIMQEKKIATSARPAQLTGLEYMRGIADGTVPPPPMARLMGMELVEADEGRAMFAAVPGEQHYKPDGRGPRRLRRDPARLGDGLCGADAHARRRQLHHPRALGQPRARHRGPTPAGCSARGAPSMSGAAWRPPRGRLFVEATGKLLAHATTTCLVTEL